MEKIDYSLPTAGIKLKNTESSISDTPEKSTEKLNKGVDVSAKARDKITSVFDRSGRPLSLSLEPKPNTTLPITLESGISKTSYDPKWNQANTGWVRLDLKYGDQRVNNAQWGVERAQSWVDTTGYNITESKRVLQDAQSSYTNAQTQLNNFYNTPSTQAALNPGYNAMNDGAAMWTTDSQGQWMITRTPGSTISQLTLDNFNQMTRQWDQYNTEVDRAYRAQVRAEQNQQQEISILGSDQRDLQNARTRMSNEERLRYRYIMWGVDMEKKVSESQKIFGELYGKKYDRNDVINQYNNSFDALGGLMTRIQKWGILTDADYKKEIWMIGNSLSKEEKMIFLGLVGANLVSLTYNQDMAKSGNLGAVKPFESMQALASAFWSGKHVPAGVCSSIHVAVASMAESWGIPAGTMTVSSGGVGHIVTMLDIDGKKVISDYGKIYTAKTMEELMDTYAISNKWAVLKNYITDASGKIIGHVDTPLSTAFRRETLSEMDISNYVQNGVSWAEGVNISLYREQKGIRGQHTLQNGVYMRGSYSEATLIKWVSAKSIKAAIGKEWKDIDLTGGWKWSGIAELNIAQSRLTYGGYQSEHKTNVMQAQAWLRGTKNLWNGSDIYGWVGMRMMWQWSNPWVPDYATLGPLGTGVSAEAGVNALVWANYQVTSDTKISWELWIKSSVWPNVQGLSKKDLNPFWAGYMEKSMRVGVETKVGSDSVVSTTYAVKKWPISEEKTIGIGYSTTDTGVILEKTQVKWTHVFGPMNQDVIRARIEKQFSKDGTLFVDVAKWGIEWKKVTAGAKWTF